MTNSRIIIVTGANRGIGRAICNLILSKSPSTLFPAASAATPKTVLYATSRNGQIPDLESSSSSQQHVQLKHSRLDISSSSSIRSFADEVFRNSTENDSHGERKNQAVVDVLINNAGVNLDSEYTPANARRTMDVNYRGTLEMCQAFLPLLRPKTGRIVNLSSVASSLKLYAPTVQDQFRDPNLDLHSLARLLEIYLDSIPTETEELQGFPKGNRSYSVSKAAVTALTRILARANSGLSINCCCPGWIDTDMGGLVGSRTLRPPKTAEEGARVPFKLAFGDLGGVTGGYWANDNVRSKDDGKLQVW